MLMHVPWIFGFHGMICIHAINIFHRTCRKYNDIALKKFTKNKISEK